MWGTFVGCIWGMSRGWYAIKRNAIDSWLFEGWVINIVMSSLLNSIHFGVWCDLKKCGFVLKSAIIATTLSFQKSTTMSLHKSENLPYLSHSRGTCSDVECLFSASNLWAETYRFSSAQLRPALIFVQTRVVTPPWLRSTLIGHSSHYLTLFFRKKLRLF